MSDESPTGDEAYRGDPSGLTIVRDSADAAVFDCSGARIDVGHWEDVAERLISRLGVAEHFVRTIAVVAEPEHSGGWADVPETLDELVPPSERTR